MSTGELRVTASPAPDADGRLRVWLEADTARHELQFESKDVQLISNTEALLAAALPLAMLWQRDLRVEGGVSKCLLEGLHTIQDIFQSWQPLLSRIEIGGARRVIREAASSGGVGLFFRATADDLYSLLKHQVDITHLIFARRLRSGQADVPTAGRISALVRSTADRLGMHAIEVATDLRRLLAGQGFNWRELASAAFNASVAHLLYPGLQRVYVADRDSYAVLEPRAEHPLLQPLWGTEGLEFITDGGEATYGEKLTHLTEEDWPLRYLHCCNRRPTAALNCGQCERCILTMLGLLAIDALDRCPTFGAPLEARAISRLRFSSRRAFTSAAENLAALRAGKPPRELVGALQYAIDRSKQRVLIGALLRDAWPAGYAMMRRLGRRTTARYRGRLQAVPA